MPIVVPSVTHTEDAPGNRLHDLLERLEPSKEGISEGASSSTDDVPTPAKPPLMRTSARPSLKKPGGKHNLHTHFPKDPKCDVCKSTQITRAFCKKNCGKTKRSPNAETIWAVITTDHKVLNEENESRLPQGFPVVVQDLATQWIQSYPCKSKTAQETMKCLRRFLPIDEDPKANETDDSMQFMKA